MFKSINRKFLVYSALYGILFGWVMLRTIKPPDENFTIRPNADQDSAMVIEGEEFRVEVRDYGEGVLNVSFERRLRWSYYFFIGVFGVLFGSYHYQSLVKQKEQEEKAMPEEGRFGVGDVVAPEFDDPEYEAFVSEDENRQLLPRPVLEEDFQKWRAERNEGRGKT